MAPWNKQMWSVMSRNTCLTTQIFRIAENSYANWSATTKQKCFRDHITTHQQQYLGKHVCLVRQLALPPCRRAPYIYFPRFPGPSCSFPELSPWCDSAFRLISGAMVLKECTCDVKKGSIENRTRHMKIAGKNTINGNSVTWNKGKNVFRPIADAVFT